jgi:serine/threonine-protein phosphatase with EF-hand domain
MFHYLVVVNEPIHPYYVKRLLKQAAALLIAEPSVGLLEPADFKKTIVVGDIHGSLEDLSTILSKHGLPSDTTRYIFNGDFVDRGSYSLEVLLTLTGLKLAHPQAVWLNRGNHEDRSISRAYGFADELKEIYGKRTPKVGAPAAPAHLTLLHQIHSHILWRQYSLRAVCGSM